MGSPHFNITIRPACRTLAIVFSLLCVFSASQGQSLQLVGKVKAEGAGVNGAKVVVLKDGKKVKTLTEGLAKFNLKLDINSTYVLSFEKDGFVTKKLQFNTGVPSDKEETEFAPFGFTVNLFPQYDDVNIVIFNQPVGMINYESDLEEFDYDTDYTKSIQSQLNAAMKEVESAKKEADKQAKKDGKEQAKQEALAEKEAEAEKEREKEAARSEAQRKKEEAELAARQTEEEPIAVEVEEEPEPVAVKETPKPKPKPVKAVINDPDRAPIESGQESRNSIAVVQDFEETPIKDAKVNKGFDEQPAKIEEVPEVERFEDTIVEKTKIITKVRFVDEGKETVYLKVYHKWGGTFYFKDGSSCSQNTFELETLGYDLMAMP